MPCYVSEKTERGNVGFSKESQSEADEQTRKMDIWECNDCFNCDDCVHCSNCVSCSDCHYCNDCLNCAKCVKCNSCEFCSFLNNCKNGRHEFLLQYDDIEE